MWGLEKGRINKTHKLFSNPREEAQTSRIVQTRSLLGDTVEKLRAFYKEEVGKELAAYEEEEPEEPVRRKQYEYRSSGWRRSSPRTNRAGRGGDRDCMCVV